MEKRVGVNYDSNSLYDALIKKDMAQLYSEITENGGFCEFNETWLYLPKEKILSNSERRIKNRGDRSKVVWKNQSPRRTVNTNARYKFEEKYEDLLKVIKDIYKVKATANCEEEYYLRSDECCVLLILFNDKIKIEAIHARGKFDFDKKVLTCNNKYPLELKADDADENSISISTAVISADGGINNFCMNLYADLFKDIEINYDTKIQETSNSLIEEIISGEQIGKTIILSGNPGTGKSYWIKSFAREIRNGFYPVIIPQANDFFYGVNNYYSVIDYFSEEKKLLFIFEDVGNLFCTSARERQPQAVSTMLNITDGIIGKGREDIFLFTFNEKIEELDKAIVRPGRCLAQMYFNPFNADEAREWVKSKELDCQIEEKEYTLADLYMMLLDATKIEAPKRKRKVALGF